jgi:bifunctional non-homologous end joining protein LigD
MGARERQSEAAEGRVKVKPGTQWLKPRLIGRVRHLKGEQELRHATLQEIKGDKD